MGEHPGTPLVLAKVFERWEGVADLFDLCGGKSFNDMYNGLDFCGRHHARCVPKRIRNRTFSIHSRDSGDAKASLQSSNRDVAEQILTALKCSLRTIHNKESHLINLSASEYLPKWCT